MNKIAIRKKPFGRKRQRRARFISRIPKNPYGGQLYSAKIESTLDVWAYMAGTLGYYSFASGSYANVGQILNQFVVSFAKDITNMFNSYAFWSLNGVSVNFDRTVNLNDPVIKRLPALYIDLLGSMTNAQANNVVSRTVAESDTALKVNLMADEVKTFSRYYKFAGNFTTISGTQAFGKGNYMTTDYFPVMNALLGQLDQPGGTETFKVGQVRCTWYATFTKRIAINNY